MNQITLLKISSDPLLNSPEWHLLHLFRIWCLRDSYVKDHFGLILFTEHLESIDNSFDTVWFSIGLLIVILKCWSTPTVWCSDSSAREAYLQTLRKLQIEWLGKFFTFDSRLTPTLRSARSQKILVTIGFVGGQKSSNLKSIVPIMGGTRCFQSFSAHDFKCAHLIG